MQVIRIEVYHHSDPAVLRAINELKEIVIMNQQELQAAMAALAGQVSAIGDQVTKIGGETTQLVALVQQLEGQLANEDISQETQAAFDALKQQVTTLQQSVQVVDDLVPDAPPPAPAPAPEPAPAPAPEPAPPPAEQP